MNTYIIFTHLGIIGRKEEDLLYTTVVQYFLKYNLGILQKEKRRKKKKKILGILVRKALLKKTYITS